MSDTTASKGRALARAALAGALIAACSRDKADPAPPPSAEPPRAAASAVPERKPAPVASAEREDCCMGKNPCRGKGGCAVPESHACKGRNACAGQGGCRAHCPR
jgi:hypothetical protein